MIFFLSIDLTYVLGAQKNLSMKWFIFDLYVLGDDALIS